MTSVIRETTAMIAAMSPHLRPGEFVFCSTVDPALAAACSKTALGMFMEAEGHSFILPAADAGSLGLDCSMPMRSITLEVHSALDGVGLTAAVSRALADAGIPCNMIAAYHHDHVFVPTAAAERALAALESMSRAAR
jgi:hypothetical protein